jgi:hypothetical protein
VNQGGLTLHRDQGHELIQTQQPDQLGGGDAQHFLGLLQLTLSVGQLPFARNPSAANAAPARTLLSTRRSSSRAFVTASQRDGGLLVGRRRDPGKPARR